MTAPARGDIESILPLTPVQESILFGTLASRDIGSDPGFLQVQCTLRGDLDGGVLRAAWEHVVARHPALRAAIHWENTERPLQVSQRRVELPWHEADWRGLEASTRQVRLAQLLREDRARGLDLNRAPVHRVTVLRFADDAARLVWTCHHTLLDGWSGAIVLGEVAAAYASLARGEPPRLPPAAPFRDYITWLQRQDPAATEAFWRAELDGLVAPTLLPYVVRQRNTATNVQPTERHATLDEPTSAALRAFGRTHRLTPGTLIQGAWAIVLAGHADASDVCFGATVSGRSSPVPGIDRMVGLFTNALPVRTRVRRDDGVVSFLDTLQQRLATLHRHTHASPAALQTWSGLPGAHRLFDSLVVFENFPADGLGEDGEGRLLWDDLHGGITSSHAVALVATPGDRISLALRYDPERIADADARRVLADVMLVLSRLAQAGDAPVADLLPAAMSVAAPGANGVSAAGSVPPLTPTELSVWGTWQQVLGTRDFGVEDDFFALGGHSLLVARVLAGIDARFGVRLPVTEFFRAPTVRALAGEVDRRVGGVASTDERRTDTRLIPLAAGDSAHGERTPFFFLHSLAGDVVVSYKLLRHFAAHRRVYGVEADHRLPDDADIEDMAASYARDIRALLPDGPYMLGGYCFGGTLAYETARQLASTEGTIALLLVIDSDPRMQEWPRATRVARAMHALRTTPPRQRARSLGRKAKKALGMLIGGGPPAPDESTGAANGASADDPLRATSRQDPAFLEAYGRYVPKPFAGRITVMVAADDPAAVVRRRLDRWAALALEGIEVVTVPGTHYTLLEEPNVRTLADRVQAALDAAASPTPRATLRSD